MEISPASSRFRASREVAKSSGEAALMTVGCRGTREEFPVMLTNVQAGSGSILRTVGLCG